MKEIWLSLLFAVLPLCAAEAPVRLGVYPNPPHTYVTAGRPQGFVVDLVGDFARRNGISVEYVEKPFGELLGDLRAGRIDLLGPIAFSEERSTYIVYTAESLVNNWSNLILPPDSPVKVAAELQGLTVAGVRNDLNFRKLQQDFLRQGIQCRYVDFPHFRDVVAAVERDEAQAGLLAGFSLQHLLSDRTTRWKIRLMPGDLYPEPLFFGVSPQRGQLARRLDQYLHDGKNDTGSFFAATYEKWYGQKRVPGWQEFISRHIVWLLGGAALAAVVLLLFFLTLRREVRRSTREITRQKLFFQNLFQNIPAGVIILDGQNRFLEMNQEFQQMFGYTADDLRREEYDRLISSDEQLEEARRYTTMSQRGERYQREVRRRTKAGTELILHLISAPVVVEDRLIGTIGIYIDIREKKHLEEEVMKAKSIESIGVLAGGIAHDFNNMLTGILGNLSLARALTDEERLLAVLEKAERAALNTKGLTQQLLTFAKGGLPRKKPLALPNLLHEALALTMSDERIQVSVHVQEPLPAVEADALQLSQVFHNILINARQAMSAGGELRVLVKTFIQQNDTARLGKGKYVAVQIHDNGPGIADENLERLFLPYFTTKATGSGLGLATAHSIVSKHGGAITVHSRLGQGATFTVYLPASSSVAVQEETPAPPVNLPAGRILLMDDEESIREVFRDMVTASGLTVETTSGSAETLELYRRNRESGTPFHLLFLDLTTPGDIGGIKTLEMLREIDPTVRAVAITGYTSSEIFRNPASFHFIDILPKPFRLDELKACIARHIQ